MYSPDYEKWISNLISVTIPVVLFMWANRNRAKQDTEKRHQENQDMLNKIAEEKKYFPLHAHGERSGPLCAEGIDYPPNGKR